MTLLGGPLTVPQGVTLLGVKDQTRILLDSNGKTGDYREFLRPGSEVSFIGLTIEQKSDFSGILFPISEDAHDIEFRHCRVVGGMSVFPKVSCHAFWVGIGKVSRLTLESLTVEDCDYALFQPNDAKGTLEEVLVENCRFERNAASDLEFNSPNGIMKDIRVRNCFFRDNLCKSPSAGFAVGFANVENGIVEDCIIQNYGSEALHVEDRSKNIKLLRNTILGASLLQPNGVILVINHSENVLIQENFIDARSNSNRPHLILVTAGGKNFSNAREVSVKSNVLVHGKQTRNWYLQEGSGPTPESNHVIPWKDDASE